MADEHFARVPHVVDAVAQTGHRRVDVELETVVGRRAFVLERHPEIAQRLIGLEPERLPHRVFLGNRVGLHGHAGEQQAANFREVLQRVGVVRVARSAHPQRVLVQLNPLGGDVAEHHRTEAAVAERQRLVPFAGRMRIEEDAGRCVLGRGVGRRGEHDEPGDECRQVFQHGWMVDLDSGPTQGNLSGTT